jgi:PII-like signaling protein
VSTESLKFTAYFGERLRSEHRFVADRLLDLFTDRSVATSVVLRGIASFGPGHHLRSDQSLSMSEDPPITVVAVDTADKIATLADQAAAMTGRGLITLERARLLTGSGMTDAPPETAKLTLYFGRSQRVSGRPAYQPTCDILRRHGFAGATVFLGVDGTAHGQRQRARFFAGNVDVPVMVIAVGSGALVERVLGELRALLERPLITVERAQLCKCDGDLLSRPPALPARDDKGRALWQKLMVYTSGSALHHGAPIHRAIVRRLRESQIASGATVLRGVWGFQGEAEPHGDKLIQLGRKVPVTTIIIDTPQRIAASFDVVDELTAEHGLVTSELVPALMSIDGDERGGGTALARHTY